MHLPTLLCPFHWYTVNMKMRSAKFIFPRASNSCVEYAIIWSSLNFSACRCRSQQRARKILHGSVGVTDAQRRVLNEIKNDLQIASPMNRLLQGDVGSGKTVVAIAAMLQAVESGYQAAFMAPTQILAEQHYAVLRRWLEPLGVRMALRTAARREENFLPLLEGNEKADVIIGTHALLYEKVSFANLGL